MNKIVSSFVLVFLLILFNGEHVQAQTQPGYGTLNTEISTVLKSGPRVPFWLWANKRGKVDGASDNLIFDIRYAAPELKKNGFTFNSGVDLTAGIAGKNSVNFSQAYASAKYGGFILKAGRYYRQMGFADSPLGLGSMVIGRHASALPGIELSTDDFIAVPFTSGYVKYKLDFGHFWFGSDRYIDNSYLHSKDFYLRIDLGRLKLSAGIIHNVVWGGTRPDGVSLGKSFDDYIRVVTGKGASEEHPNTGEILTALGNAVAAYDTGILWVSDNYRIQASRLFFLEDKSSLLFRSAWDGQWTLDVEPRNWGFLKHFRYDYFYTIRQDAFANQPGGRANYYGHSIYKSGWSYQSKVLGVPLITLDFDKSGINTTTNNMIVAQSVAARMSLFEGFEMTASLLYSRNYGVCQDLKSPAGEGCRGSIEKDIPLDVVQRHTVRKDHYLFGTEFAYALKDVQGMHIKMGLGLDIKQKQPTTYGLTLGVLYSPFN